MGKASPRGVIPAALVLALACSLLAAAPAAAADSPAEAPPHAAGELLVQWASGTSPSARAEARAQHGLARRRTLPLGGVELAVFEGGRSAVGLAQRLSRDPVVEFAEPNWLLHSAAAPDDPEFGKQWGLRNTGQMGGTAGIDIAALDAWPLGTGAGVVVAVIDSGTDIDHADLEANIAPGGRSWDGGVESGPAAGHSHGTHVSGIVAAVTDNGIGVAGSAPGAKVLPLTFMWPKPGGTSGFTSDAVLAIDYAKTQGARVANASWGSGGNSSALENAIAASGMVFVAAAGNDGANVDSTPFYPCAYDLANLICVASVTRTGALSSFSNHGVTSVHVGAPGSDVISTLPGGLYGTLSGTSMAAPHVSGVAALVAARDPSLTPAQIVARVKGTARPLASLSGTTATGGMVHAGAAIGPVLVQPANLDFGVQEVDEPSAAQTATVTNVGHQPLDVTAITVPPPFSVDTESCTADPVPAGDSCSAEIIFSPPAAQPYSGQLTVTHGATGETATAELAGAGGVTAEPVRYLVSASDTEPTAGSTITMTAQLVDGFDEPVEDADHAVSWTSSGGTLAAAQGTTDAQGRASVSFTVGTNAGAVHSVTATTGDWTGTSAPITVQAGPAAEYVVSASTTSPFTGASVTINAQLTDAHGNAVGLSAQEVTWAATNGGSFEPAASSTSGTGAASTTFTVSDTAGTTHVVTATDTAERTGASSPITVRAPAAGGGGGGGGGFINIEEPPPEEAAEDPDGLVEPGGTATTDPDGTGPTSANPLQVGVTTPSGGVVSIAVGSPTGAAAAGYRLLPVQADITAPTETVANPLVLSFALDGSLGATAQGVVVFRNGVRVGACPGSSTATPDPCVSSRRMADGDVDLVVLTSRASAWSFGVAEPAEPDQEACPLDLPAAGFADVPSDSVHARSIDCVVWHDIARGTTTTTYAPAATVTRAQMASFLARAAGVAGHELPPAAHGFTDVEGSVHEEAIGRLAAAGVVQGVEPSRYAPDAPVSREQMATFLVRAAELILGAPLLEGTTEFTDVAESVHHGAIAKAVTAGYTSGRTPTTYAPREPVRRDQMASFLARLLDGLLAP